MSPKGRRYFPELGLWLEKFAPAYFNCRSTDDVPSHQRVYSNWGFRHFLFSSFLRRGYWVVGTFRKYLCKPQSSEINWLSANKSIAVVCGWTRPALYMQFWTRHALYMQFCLQNAPAAWESGECWRGSGVQCFHKTLLDQAQCWHR